MYYEARHHAAYPVANAMEAAKVIKEGAQDFYSNSVPTYTTPQGKVYIVPDGHIDSPFSEVAVIWEKGGQRQQIESVTACWVDDYKRLAKYFDDAVASPFIVGDGKAILSIDDEMSDSKVRFTCTCCGTGFMSTIREQKQYDQDNGFGVCPAHTHYYR